MLAIIFGGVVFSLFYDVEEKKPDSPYRCWPMCSVSIKDGG